MNLPLRDRQFHESELTILSLDSSAHVWRWTWAALGAPIVVAAFVGLTSWSANSWSSPSERPTMLYTVLMAPLVAHLVCGWIVRNKHRALSLRLRQEMQARPTHDGNWTCRVCGASIAKVDLDAPVVACGYCHVDNLLDRTIVGDVVGEELVTFESFAQQATARARRTQPTTRTLSALLWLPLVSVVLLWMGCTLDECFGSIERANASYRAADPRMARSLVKVLGFIAEQAIGLDERNPDRLRIYIDALTAAHAVRNDLVTPRQMAVARARMHRGGPAATVIASTEAECWCPHDLMLADATAS